MTGRVLINFAPGEGAVVRVLGLVERRGFSLCSLTMEECSGGASMTLDLEPRDPSRRVDVLARQICRLIHVHSVSVVTANPGLAA